MLWYSSWNCIIWLINVNFFTGPFAVDSVSFNEVWLKTAYCKVKDLYCSVWMSLTIESYRLPIALMIWFFESMNVLYKAYAVKNPDDSVLISIVFEAFF